MNYLPLVNDIVPGDRVLTSGIDQIYPKGIVVGEVSAISRETNASDQYVVVLPSVDFLHLEEVLVLRNKVQREGEKLPSVPTAVPKPVPTMRPTPVATAAADQINSQDENAPWSRPTLVPDADVPNNLPKTQPTVAPVFPIPEDEWAAD
jgi:hypothetical protein